MKSVILREPDIIGGIPRAAGELVVVPDDYDADNIAQTVRPDLEAHNRRDTERRKQDAEGKREERRKAKEEREEREKPPKPVEPPRGKDKNGRG